MRRLSIWIMLAPALVVGCARHPEKVTRGTLAELRDLRPDVEEAKVEQGLNQAMQHYRRFLEDAPETTMTPEAMRRLADLQLEKQFGVKLGFSSFFVKAVIEGLKRFPVVNAAVDGSDIVYREFYDIGVAVSTDRGLVVPVLRDADQLTFAQIEKAVGDFAARARSGTLTMEDLTGGSFSITNGGVFGSLMSTPIVNAPQSAILGMHKIQERPVVVDGQIVVRPMMYLALTYDHRIIDGKEAVQFLVTIKEALEDPGRLLLGI